MKVLALNSGSNSLKFDLVEVTPRSSAFGRKLFSGSFDDIGKDEATFSRLQGKHTEHCERRDIPDYGAAATQLFEMEHIAGFERVGHRVVHGADLFDAPARITPEVLERIESLDELAPLHNASALAVMRATREKLGDGIPMYAVFDTVFHRGLPAQAALYGLPLEVAQRHKIRRYGFHGISHHYLLRRYAQLAGKPESAVSVITLHLEGGSSVCAIRGGRSVDTSMGFTPLEGLVMGTRCGDLDPALVTYLMRTEKLDAAGVEELLNKRSGLLGLSGRSEDTRELVKHLDDPRTALALDIFAYRVRKYVGAYLAALDGEVDAVIFGGGISENTPVIREKVMAGLSALGLELDPALSRNTVDQEARISADTSRIEIWLIPTDEGQMIADETAAAG